MGGQKPGINGEITRDFVTSTFVVHEGKVLLLFHRKLKKWLPPGGHIDPQELPDDAARREVREETGIEVQLVADYEPPGIPYALARPEGIQLEDIEPGHQHIDLVYFARPCGGVEIRSNHESEGIGWFGPEDLDRLDLIEEVRAWCHKALAKLGAQM